MSGDKTGGDAVYNRIALLRAEQGVTRRELADALGVHYQTVGYLERGEYSPSLYLALRIAEFFAAGPSGPETAFPQLTAREREVLDLVAAGRSNAQIAAALYLSPKTVRNNVSNVLTKLQVTDRAQAIVRAREAGLGR